jgi:dihydrodipicolinate synthase/N-acetylneuraminate lyase
MHWRIAEAKQKFSALIHASLKEPQLIYNRSDLVAAVIEAETFREFLAWREQNPKRAIAETLADLQKLCIEEEYVLEIPPRQDRANPFDSVLQ